jgi:hypothetical protein
VRASRRCSRTRAAGDGGGAAVRRAAAAPAAEAGPAPVPGRDHAAAARRLDDLSRSRFARHPVDVEREQARYTGRVARRLTASAGDRGRAQRDAGADFRRSGSGPGRAALAPRRDAAGRRLRRRVDRLRRARAGRGARRLLRRLARTCSRSAAQRECGSEWPIAAASSRQVRTTWRRVATGTSTSVATRSC